VHNGHACINLFGITLLGIKTASLQVQVGYICKMLATTIIILINGKSMRKTEPLKHKLKK